MAVCSAQLTFMSLPVWGVAAVEEDSQSISGVFPECEPRPPRRGSCDLSGQVGPGAFVASCSMICYTCPVSRTIPQRELRNDNARVMDAVAAGETLIVTRNGVPVAEIRPIRNPRRTFVPKSELIALSKIGPHIDLQEFRADLDRTVEQGL